MSWRRAAPWLLLFAALAAIGGGGLDALRPPESADKTAVGPGRSLTAVVTRIVDGDTVRVRTPTGEHTVRYIGVDTPETVKPNRPVECFGKAAGEHNTRLVARQAVILRFDAEPRDRYGRLLAYVYRRRDKLFVNGELLQGGFATTLTITPNLRHARELRALERRARAAGRGLWGACPR